MYDEPSARHGACLCIVLIVPRGEKILVSQWELTVLWDLYFPTLYAQGVLHHRLKKVEQWVPAGKCQEQRSGPCVPVPRVEAWPAEGGQKCAVGIVPPRRSAFHFSVDDLGVRVRFGKSFPAEDRRKDNSRGEALVGEDKLDEG